MKVPAYAPLTEGQFVGVPEELQRVVSRDEKQLEVLTNALIGRLGIENLQAEVVEVALKHDTEAILRVGLRSMPRRATVLWTEEYSYYDFKWRVVDSRRVAVTVKWDSAPAARVLTRIELRPY